MPTKSIDLTRCLAPTGDREFTRSLQALPLQAACGQGGWVDARDVSF